MRSAMHKFVLGGGVVLLHVGAVWALQSGLMQRAIEVIVPVRLFGEFVAPPAPKVESPPPAPARHAVQRKAVVPAPMPLAIADASPAPNAPVGVMTQASPLPPIATTLTAEPAPAKVELPSSDADYLHNPKPVYPYHSRRLGEQGRVVVRVLIGVDGTAQQAEIRQSSGFRRLDQAALATVQGWRYVPGKRGGVPEAMWFSVPLNFVLE